MRKELRTLEAEIQRIELQTLEAEIQRIKDRYVKVVTRPVNVLEVAHLSKLPSDLRQNGTQEKTPFSGTVFHTLSCGVLRFVASVSPKNQ